MASLDRPKLLRAAAVVLAWMVLGLFFFTQDLTRKALWGDPTPWWQSLIAWQVGVLLCAAFTPGILWLGRRFPLGRTRTLRRVLLHLVCSVLFSLVHLTIESAILANVGFFPQVTKNRFVSLIFVLMVLGFHSNIITYWLVLGFQAAFRTYRQYQERRQEALRLELQASELKTQLVQAQLTALKGQLQPHFLFNTLNAIMVLVRQEKGRQAEEMLARLSDLLRCVLEDVEAQEVPLRRELEYLQIYLSIEQVRFQDRLRVTISAEPAALDAAFPHMGLQPIVENAVKHGLGRRSSAGRIDIRAARVNGRLEVQVRDDGPGVRPEDVEAARGIGLANTRARLRQLYGAAATLTLENGEAGGAVATIILPYRAEAGPATSEVMEIHALDHVDR